MRMEKPNTTFSGITQDELIRWGGPEVFNQALALCNSGDVEEAVYDDEMLTIRGKIARPDGWSMPVSLTLNPGERITSHCPCRANREFGQICSHVVALGIAVMVHEMEECETSSAGASAKDEAAPVEAETDNTDYIEVPLKPRFYAFVSGSRASLSIELDAYYGEINFPACSLQSAHTVYLPDPDDPLVRRTRTLSCEREAVATLEKWGFARGYRENDLRLYLTDPQRVLNFLGSGLPTLRRRGWRLDLSDRLMALTDAMPSVVPVVTLKDAPNGAFDVRYTFDAMGTEISPLEIQAALNRGDGYLLRDNQVVLLDKSAIETMHEVFRDCASTQGDAPKGWFRVSRVHAPYVKSSLDRLDAVDLDDSAAREWRQTAATRNREAGVKFEPIALGPLDKVLRPYQKEGVYWMRFLENAALGGLLADEMGLGKTLQTLTWLSLPRVRETVHRPALIIAPTSLVRNWEAEARRFTPNLRVLVVSGPHRAEVFDRIPEADLVITSYALLPRDLEAAYLGRVFSAIVLDEAQHIKNRDTKNARTVKTLQTDRRLVLTGTPIENSVSDVWSIFDFLMPDYLGDYESFKLSYEMPIAEGGAAAEEAQDRLKRKLHPFILRRLKKTVAKDLPDKLIKVSYCPLSEEAEREYNALKLTTRHEVSSLVQEKGLSAARFEILAKLMKLRQIASRGKLESFLEQLTSAIAGGHRILVFSQFVKTLQLIAQELNAAQIPFCYLDGSTQNRLEECNRFNHTPTIPVFLISLMAGGTGLNLTGADMVIHYDPWWNPAVEDQATDRAHRIGQTKKVYVIKMIASHTLEEKVLELQRRKQAVIAATVSTTDKAVMEKLTSDDLIELLN